MMNRREAHRTATTLERDIELINLEMLTAKTTYFRCGSKIYDILFGDILDPNTKKLVDQKTFHNFDNDDNERCVKTLVILSGRRAFTKEKAIALVAAIRQKDEAKSRADVTSILRDAHVCDGLADFMFEPLALLLV